MSCYSTAAVRLSRGCFIPRCSTRRRLCGREPPGPDPHTTEHSTCSYVTCILCEGRFTSSALRPSVRVLRRVGTRRPPLVPVSSIDRNKGSCIAVEQRCVSLAIANVSPRFCAEPTRQTVTSTHTRCNALLPKVAIEVGEVERAGEMARPPPQKKKKTKAENMGIPPDMAQHSTRLRVAFSAGLHTAMSGG